MTKRTYSRTEFEEAMHLAAGAASGVFMRADGDLVMPTQEVEEAVAGVLRYLDEREPMDLLEAAWGIIANAHGGNWEDASREWRDAAARFRERWHALLERDEPQATNAAEDVGSIWHRVSSCPVCGAAAGERCKPIYGAEPQIGTHPSGGPVNAGWRA